VRGLFITGTDTGAGKTALSAALLAAIVAAGEPVRAYKPVVTGVEAAPEAITHQPNVWPPDHELLADAAGMDSNAVSPLRYAPAVSPHLAAALAGERIDPAQLLLTARGATDQISIVEGVGGLLVPLTEDYSVRDFAIELGLPLVVAARAGLGTINHTLLTLEAARAAQLDVRAVVLTPWPEEPSVMERSNRETIARLGAVEVHGLEHLPSPDRDGLARAGARLPWRRWLAKESLN